MRHAFALVIAVGGLLAGGAAASVSPPWLGAAALLEPSTTTKKSPTQEFAAELERWGTGAGSLAPDVAADQFDALVQRARQLGGEATHQVFAVLPPPASWVRLQRLWQQRAKASGASDKDRALAVLGDVLVAGPQRSKAAIAALHLDDRFLDPAQPASARGRIEALINGEVSRRQASDVGDLVGEVGEEEAGRLLLRAMRLPARSFRAEGATLALAHRVVAEHIAELASPPWDLVTATSPPALFELIEKRFVPPGAAIGPTATLPHVIDRTTYAVGDSARVAYVVALLKTDPAAAKRALGLWLERQPMGCASGLVDDAETAAVLPKLVDLLMGALRAPPQAPGGVQCLGQLVVAGALRVGRGKALLAALPPSDESVAGRAWRDARVDVHLALDDVDAAAALLRSVIANPEAGDSPRAAAAKRLLEIGIAANDEKRVTQGIDGVLDRCATATGWECSEALSAARDQLIARQQGPRFEAWLKQRLETNPDDPDQRWARGLYLEQAVITYSAAGRSADALRVLEASAWPVSDVIEFDQGSGGVVAVARALVDAGRRAEASRLLRGSMGVDAHARGAGIANDEAWELLVRIEGKDALAFIDEQHRRDTLEDRPLIWRAWLLAEQGDLAAAEVAARAAIALDPADGDQRRGHRFRAYVVLGEILRASRRDTEASVFEDAVAAVRIGEDADRLREAGLLTRAAQTYGRALARFADAYCLQSRLGIVEARLGLPTAREHLRQAYRLLPSSFGPLESHCLACDGLFSTREALHLGEGVLRERLGGAPDDARAHYFLGRVLEEQGQTNAARSELLRAWRLDGGYVGALRALTEGDGALGAGPDRDSAEIARLRIDPGCVGGRCPVDVADDLAAVYTAAAAQLPLGARPVGFPLRASPDVIAPDLLDRDVRGASGAAAVRAHRVVMLLIGQLSLDR